MNDRPAVESAPWPERNWLRSWFTGLDIGRSAAMKNIVAKNGQLTAIYMLCVNFWVLIFGAFMIPGVALKVVSVKYPPVGELGSVLFIISLVFALITFVRMLQAWRANRAFQRRNEQPPAGQQR